MNGLTEASSSASGERRRKWGNEHQETCSSKGGPGVFLSFVPLMLGSSVILLHQQLLKSKAASSVCGQLAPRDTENGTLELLTLSLLAVHRG